MANKEQGTTGLFVFSGIIQEEFLKELRGREGYKRYDEARRNSPVIGAMLYYHEMAIRGVSWNFTNKYDAKAKDERIDFLNASREKMAQSWNDFISEVLTFIPFGYSLFWTNYRRDKLTNNIMWDTFSPRKQNTVFQWLLNYPGTPQYDPNKRNGEILGFIQQAPPTYKTETLLSERLIHFRTRVEANNPEGISLLRNAWVPYYYTKNLQSVEAIGFERDLAGLPHIGLPQAANVNADDPNSDFNRAAETVRNMRNDEQGGVVTPFGYTVTLLASSGKGFADIGKAIERYESRTLMAMLSQFIMLGQNGVGSLALSKDSTSMAEMIVNTTADIVADTFTKQEIPRILAMNGWDSDGICLEHSPAGDSDLTLFADFLQKVGDKLTWDASDEVWLRQWAGLPEKSEQDIQGAMDEAAAKAEEAKQQFLQRAKETQGNQPVGVKTKDDKPMPDMNKLTFFAADGKPADERKRRQIEKQWNTAMADFLVKQKRRVMKGAREMKGL